MQSPILEIILCKKHYLNDNKTIFINLLTGHEFLPIFMWERVFHFTKFCLSFLYQLLQLNCFFLIIFVRAFTQPVLNKGQINCIIIYNCIELNLRDICYKVTSFNRTVTVAQLLKNRELTIVSLFSRDK